MSCFVINWEQQQAICPMGRRSSSRTAAIDHGRNAVIKIRFSRRDCHACVSQPLCTREARRIITVRPHEQYLSMQAARQHGQTEAYKLEYAMRAGIEGTISLAVRTFGIRRARYMGAAKIHLQNILTAAAINFVHVGRWLAGARPARTCQSSFVALMTQAAALG
jgi:transposase